MIINPGPSECGALDEWSLAPPGIWCPKWPPIGLTGSDDKCHGRKERVTNPEMVLSTATYRKARSSLRVFPQGPTVKPLCHHWDSNQKSSDHKHGAPKQTGSQPTEFQPAVIGAHRRRFKLDIARLSWACGLLVSWTRLSAVRGTLLHRGGVRQLPSACQGLCSHLPGSGGVNESLYSWVSARECAAH